MRYHLVHGVARLQCTVRRLNTDEHLLSFVQMIYNTWQDLVWLAR